MPALEFLILPLEFSILHVPAPEVLIPTLGFLILLLVVSVSLPFWLLWRSVRALEKIASKIEQLPDNENSSK